MSALLEAVGRLDFALFQRLRTPQVPLLDAFMAGLSDIGRGNAIWIALAMLIGFLHRSRWPAVVQVLLAVGITFLVTDYVAKPFFNRARPFESYTESRVYGYKPMTRSFPSGHAAGAIAGAYALARLAPEGRAIFWLLAALIAFSRVYLGVHYPGDVLGGAILGLGIGKFVVGGTRWELEDWKMGRLGDSEG